jgi:uroporphyrinogen-III synthase
MRVLVTRPQAQTTETANALRNLGHSVLIDPVLAIERLPIPPLDLQDVAGILLTSANAVPALTPEMSGVPIFCVGAATAHALEATGISPRAVGLDDGKALVELVAKHLRPELGRVVHLSGEEVAASTGRALEAAGFRWQRIVVYRAAATPTLSPTTRDALLQDALDAVLFFSPRSAAVWCDHVDAAGLGGSTGRLVAACLSEAVAKAAARLRWRDLRVAATRDQTALLDCLDAPQ